MPALARALHRSLARRDFASGRFKQVAEILMIARLLVERGALRQQEARRLLRPVLRLGMESRLLEKILFVPQTFRMLGSILADLSFFNGTGAEACRHLQGLASRVDLEVFELTEMRRLDLRNVLRRLAIAAGRAEPPRLAMSKSAAASLVARNIAPQLVTDELVYTFTHVIFYRSGFGTLPSRLSPRAMHKLKANLDLMNAYALARKNLDMLAELALCRLFLNLDEPWLRRSIAHLAHGQRRNGIIPRYTDKHARGWLKNYHSTLVGLWALAEYAARSDSSAGRPLRHRCNPERRQEFVQARDRLASDLLRGKPINTRSAAMRLHVAAEAKSVAVPMDELMRLPHGLEVVLDLVESGSLPRRRAVALFEDIRLALQGRLAGIPPRIRFHLERLGVGRLRHSAPIVREANLTERLYGRTAWERGDPEIAIAVEAMRLIGQRRYGELAMLLQAAGETCGEFRVSEPFAHSLVAEQAPGGRIGCRAPADTRKSRSRSGDFAEQYLVWRCLNRLVRKGR